MTTFRVSGWAKRFLLGLALIPLAAGHDAGAQEQGPVPDRVIGLVSDPAGRPVPDAQVFGAFESPGDDPDGEAVAGWPRATTDEAGRFALDWPSLPTGRGEPALWVVRAGSRLARLSVPRRPAGRVIRIVIDPEVGPAAAVVEVVDPRGGAVADARVRPTRWFEGNVAATSARVWAIPAVVGDLLAGRTDASGRATLRGVAALRLTAVVVESGLGRQVVSWDESIVARQRSIKLLPAGRLGGEVRGDRPGAGAGLRVAVTTRVAGRVVGRATLTADAAGRFEAVAVAAGGVEVRLLPDSQAAGVAEAVHLDLDAGAEANAVLTLRRGVRIGGKVVERETRRPVVGAWVAVAGPDDSNPIHAQADANGEFAATTLPGPVVVRLAAVPGDFLLPFAPGRAPRREVPATSPNFEWPPLELDRGVALLGRVLDDLGRPAGPGVAVTARWTVRDGRAHDDQAATTETDAAGRYLVGPVPPGVEVTLAAQRPGHRGGHRTVTAAAGENGPVEIQLPHPDPMLAPAGRVVDATGRPVANALVQFRVADPGLTARGPRSGRRVAASGLDAVVTDSLGRYRASGRVDGRHRYLATAEAAGCESGRTRAVSPHPAPGDETFAFPDLVVERHLDPPVVVGRVVGRDGRPIAGAEVTDLAHHHATADAAGWFQLEKVGAAGETCLFVRHPDHRFAGRTLSPLEADRPVTLVLGRRDEPAAAGVAARPEDAGARAMIRRLLRSLLVEPFIERVLARPDAVAKVDLLEHLARVEPARVARWLAGGVVADPRTADGLRRIAARHLAPADFPRAAVILAAIEDPAARCRATLEALDRAEGLDPAAKRGQLEAVERLARTIIDPGRRAVALARVAGSWLDLGDAPRAGAVLAEASALAERLPRATEGARAWCALIEPLARLDPAQAQQRLRHLLDPADLDRCQLAIALRSARSRPAEAVQAWRQVRDFRLRLRATAEVCYLLGSDAPDRARGLADAIRTAHPAESAHALGMLAAALARRDKPAARATLDEAFLRLEAARTDPATVPEAAAEPAAVAAALLPVAEAIDPALLPEYFWRAVALRPTRPQPNLRADALLAVLLDRYDPAVARVVFDPDRTRPASIAPVDLPALLLAATQLAPRLAFEWADHPAGGVDPPAARPSPGDRPHLALIAAWTETDRGRWDRAVREYLDLWTPPES